MPDFPDGARWFIKPVGGYKITSCVSAQYCSAPRLGAGNSDGGSRYVLHGVRAKSLHPSSELTIPLPGLVSPGRGIVRVSRPACRTLGSRLPEAWRRSGAGRRAARDCAASADAMTGSRAGSASGARNLRCQLVGGVTTVPSRRPENCPSSRARTSSECVCICALVLHYEIWKSLEHA
jgi:hypothetical protein